MLPLFPRHHAHQTVYADARHSLDRTAFMGAAHALAQRLPSQTHCLNLCDDRLFFMLGFCAALLRGQCTLLPASRTESSLADIARRHPRITALCDDPEAFTGLACLHLDASLLQTRPQLTDEGIPPATLAAELYTSGSTGAPQAHRKTWGILVQGAQQLAAELNFGGTLLGSVPSQHMFGLESTILLPMQAGLTLAGSCPLLPQDIHTAMQRLPSPLWWATTPLHLRACVQSGLKFPKLAGIVCATQTLAPDLARAAEACFQAPLHEIYGCTEAGAIATRRPAQGVEWRPLPDWDMTRRGKHIWISGTRSPQALCLPDHIELLPDRRFLLQGRHASLIKVGGKRMHLDALNQILLSVPGVEDGVFFQPAEGGRLTALVVAADPDPAALMAALRKQIDPVFLPRPIHWVSSLPRNAVGKLPLHALQHLVDELSR
jgi:acyl-coenzyme A synthetase/AMP-(fatty) acid ligase